MSLPDPSRARRHPVRLVRNPLSTHLAMIEMVDRQGRRAIAHHGPSALADMAATLFAAVRAAQSDALPGASKLDIAAIEDVGEWFLLRAAERKAGQ